MSGPIINYDYADVPTVAEFAASNARIRGLVGPFRSGKSSGSVVEIIRRAQAQRHGTDGVKRSRWIVVRNTFAQLEDSTIPTTMMWLPPIHFGKYTQRDHTYTVSAFPNCEFEIWFRALDRPDHVRNLLSVECTGAWFNEAREIPWPIVEAMDGRIGQYPSKTMGGVTWEGMWLDTNPPDTDSRWYRYFEETKHDPEHVRVFHQPSGRAENAENLTNLNNPRYYHILAVGKDPAWIKVYIDGQYGFVAEGKSIYPEYNDRVHCQEVEPIPGVPIMRGWDFGLCYSDDTEVLTDHGWKLFKDVDEKTDRAASRDPKPGALERSPIVFKVAMPFNGDMLHWQSTELDMMVTPEHIVPFTRRDHPDQVEWQSAEWISENMGAHLHVDLLSNWEPAPLELGRQGMSNRAFAEFMGLYLSEGSTDRGRVTIYQKEDDPEMRRILAATGLNWPRKSSGKTAGWRVYAPALADYLKAFGKAQRKHVPREIKAMGRDDIRAFIMAYTLGDGHIRTRSNGSVEHTLFTTSKAMADDMQELAQKAGWNSSLRVIAPQTSILDGRTIQGGGGYSIAFKKRACRAEMHKRNFQRVPYDGTVYCLNVPHHTLYVRRGGRPHWNGNTPSCIFAQELPDGRFLVFDEMVSDNMGIDQFADEVNEHCNRAFRGQKVAFEDWGDPAGNQRAQTDLRSCFEIMHTKGIMVEGSVQNPMMRWESVKKPLRTLVGGEPQFILHPRCKQLRKGFMGGYHRRRMQVSGPERYAIGADKNQYSHPHDGLQYIAVQLFAPAGPGYSNEDAEFAALRDRQDDFVSNPTRSNVTGY